MICTGAIAGDMIGCKYEFLDFDTEYFRNSHITKTGLKFSKEDFGYFTDNTVLTLAIKNELNNVQTFNLKPNFEECCIIDGIPIKYNFKDALLNPDAGYGMRFYNWLISNNPEPYNSFGNGSAMRVSSIGWHIFTMDDCMKLAELSAIPTHNHPEGIKGAQAIAACILLSRKLHHKSPGMEKKDIKTYIENKFGYDLSIPLDSLHWDINKNNDSFDISCQVTVPQAIIAFLESDSFEEAIINAICIGGDTDTIAAMTGSIAEAYYGVPFYIEKMVGNFLPDDLKEVLYNDALLETYWSADTHYRNIII